eukprot:SAG22_NODE_9508_length_586_cov_0.854209_1_plen_112_part_10
MHGVELLEMPAVDFGGWDDGAADWDVDGGAAAGGRSPGPPSPAQWPNSPARKAVADLSRLSASRSDEQRSSSQSADAALDRAGTPGGSFDDGRQRADKVTLDMAQTLTQADW